MLLPGRTMADFHLDGDGRRLSSPAGWVPETGRCSPSRWRRVMPFHWSLPIGAARLSGYTRHLGGEPHCSRGWTPPRTASAHGPSYAVIAVLDHLQREVCVVTAPASSRARNRIRQASRATCRRGPITRHSPACPMRSRRCWATTGRRRRAVADAPPRWSGGVAPCRGARPDVGDSSPNWNRRAGHPAGPRPRGEAEE